MLSKLALSFIISITGIILESIKCERSVTALGIEQTSNEIDISDSMDILTSDSYE